MGWGDMVRQAGWIWTDMQVGMDRQVHIDRRVSRYGWICWIDMNGHMQVDMDGRVGMNEQVGQI